MKKIELYEIDCIPDLFVASYKEKGHRVVSVVNKNHECLLPFYEIDEEIEYFCARNRMDSYFTFINKGISVSYHLSKENDEYAVVSRKESNKNQVKKFVYTEKDNYWVVEHKYKDFTTYSLYDVKKRREITPEMTEISFEEDDDYVLAYIEKDLYYPENDEMVYVTSLLSFINKDGKFVTPFYNTKADKFYESRYFNDYSGFKEYYQFENALASSAYQKCIADDDYVTGILSNMFENCYDETELSLSREKPAKILKFEKGCKK